MHLNCLLICVLDDYYGNWLYLNQWSSCLELTTFMIASSAIIH